MDLYGSIEVRPNITDVAHLNCDFTFPFKIFMYVWHAAGKYKSVNVRHYGT